MNTPCVPYILGVKHGFPRASRFTDPTIDGPVGDPAGLPPPIPPFRDSPHAGPGRGCPQGPADPGARSLDGPGAQSPPLAALSSRGRSVQAVWASRAGGAGSSEGPAGQGAGGSALRSPRRRRVPLPPYPALFGIIRRDAEMELVPPTTTRIPGQLIRTGTKGLRLLGLLLTVCAQSVRSHAVTSSPFRDSAHMDAYAPIFPI